MGNSVDPDQPDLTGAIWSESTLFVQACLSENIRSLRYHESYYIWLYLFGDLKICCKSLFSLFIMRKPAFGVVQPG